MSNTTFATGVGTKINQFTHDICSNFIDYRTDYLDLREAAITTERLKYAANSLKEGGLSKDEAEGLIKKADEAIGSYNYSNDISESWKVIPESMRRLMAGMLVALEFLVALTTFDAFCGLPLTYTFSLVLIVAVVMDLLAFCVAAKVTIFFIKVRIARIEGYESDLINYIKK